MIEAGRLEEARGRLIEIIRRNRTDSVARLALGYIYLDPQPEMAASIANDILKAGPRNKQALDLMSAAYALMRTRARSVREERDLRLQQVEVLDKIITRHPDWPSPIYAAASIRIAVERLDPNQSNELNRALGSLQKLVGLLDSQAAAPSVRATAWFQLGRAFKHIEDSYPDFANETGLPQNYEQAVRSFRTAIDIDPRRIDAVGEMVLIYRAVGDLDAALAIVDEGARQIARGYKGQAATFVGAKLAEMKGALLLEKGLTLQAEAVFVRALADDPKLVGSAMSLAHLQQVSNRHAQAEATLRALLSEVPGSLDGWLALATFLEESGRVQQAIAAHWSLAAITPPDAVAMGMQPSPERHRANLRYRSASRLAALEMAAGHPELALRAATIARSHQEPDADLHVTVALIFEALGRRESAIKRLHSVFEETQSPEVESTLRAMQARSEGAVPKE